VIVEPPFETGSVHETVVWPSPPLPVMSVGAPGSVAGVAPADAEGLLLPTALVASTVNE
jgi:hypothetical protein